ncbi:hypothetical protein PIROE2DRAFT_16825 [Piromyces sp. E2]|nr:hypothetical protein PIROE2DRAFT_16825 [Piromyces sp. E2]|eukprot:OUM58013.1 hypothetical protein PIROE2DRAFT_16825 [Piromyces sp. E2]
MPDIIKNYLLEFKKINFNNVFPGYNFGEIIPELIIDENGNSNIDIDQIVSGFDYNPKHYDEGNPEKFLNHILSTNENFKLLDIINILKGMKMANTGNEIEFRFIIENLNEYFISKLYESKNKFDLNSSLDYIKGDIELTLKFYKATNFTSTYPGYDFNEILPELQIGEDGCAKFDIKEVYRGFNFDPEYYKENYPDIEELYQLLIYVYNSNKNFDILKISESISKLDLSKDKDINYLMEKLNNLSNTPIITAEYHKENINQTKENQAFFDDTLTEFKTKNATMSFNLNGNEKKFKKITFSLGGQYSRSFSKPNYNLKIRGGEDLYGRSHFKLRSDCIEPTFLRTKLVSDIHNRLGLKSGSANYIQLYINDKYMGLYIITDLFKLSWIEKVYGEKDTTTLYKCKNIFDLSPTYSEGCVNENEDVTDETEWINFLTAVKNAKSASDLEDIFEIDHFLYEMAIEYLTNGWDHILNAHNFYMYKQPNGKWIYLSFDFDLDIGQYYENINKVFNPSILYPHIDELKQFIKPYVELDKILNSEGLYPGRFDNKSKLFSMEQWDAYSEFNTGVTDRTAYGLNITEISTEISSNNATDISTEIPSNNATDISTENSTIIQNEITITTTTKIPSEHSTSSVIIEEETVYDVDVPTVVNDDESYSEEEEEEDTTESNESFSLISKSTITKTITKTIAYKTILN